MSLSVGQQNQPHQNDANLKQKKQPQDTPEMMDVAPSDRAATLQAKDSLQTGELDKQPTQSSKIKPNSGTSPLAQTVESAKNKTFANVMNWFQGLFGKESKAEDLFSPLKGSMHASLAAAIANNPNLTKEEAAQAMQEGGEAGIASLFKGKSLTPQEAQELIALIKAESDNHIGKVINEMMDNILKKAEELRRQNDQWWKEKGLPQKLSQEKAAMQQAIEEMITKEVGAMEAGARQGAVGGAAPTTSTK